MTVVYKLRDWNRRETRDTRRKRGAIASVVVPVDLLDVARCVLKAGHKDGWIHYAIWGDLERLAAMSPTRGVLLRADNSQPHTPASIAAVIGVGVELVQTALERLASAEIGWVEIEVIAHVNGAARVPDGTVIAASPAEAPDGARQAPVQGAEPRADLPSGKRKRQPGAQERAPNCHVGPELATDRAEPRAEMPCPALARAPARAPDSDSEVFSSIRKAGEGEGERARERGDAACGGAADPGGAAAAVLSPPAMARRPPARSAWQRQVREDEPACGTLGLTDPHPVTVEWLQELVRAELTPRKPDLGVLNVFAADLAAIVPDASQRRGAMRRALRDERFVHKKGASFCFFTRDIDDWLRKGWLEIAALRSEAAALEAARSPKSCDSPRDRPVDSVADEAEREASKAIVDELYRRLGWRRDAPSMVPSPHVGGEVIA